MRTLFFVFSLIILCFLTPFGIAYSQNIESPFSDTITPAPSKSPETIENDPYAIATDAEIEEAQRFYESCMSNNTMKKQKDCKCAAASYLETRIALGRAATVEEIMQENINTCLLDEKKGAVSDVEDLNLDDVTEQQMEEAMSVYSWCEGLADVKNQVDCECLAAKFLDLRMKRGPLAERSVMIAEITQKSCRNIVETTGMEYSTCMTGSTFSYFGIRPKDYCECYARRWANLFDKYEGRMDEYIKSSIRLNARSYCSKPESYKNK